ncbi:hypothetical protein ACJMK2_035309 [Sinanodonta woodiana]|uniref:Exosome complex component RRP46 n=2 Tax=Sinanodonta woodiana TaxID=1069815 RepID=A0ABD3WUI8_SINWO
MSDSSKQSNLRVMSAELSLLSRPDGSATLFQGDTCVMSSVYGPGEVRINKELIDRATVEVIYKPKSGLPGCTEKSQERLIRNTCETVLLTSLHPRSSISLTVQEMQNSGSLLACCINSMCLALLDSGVNMKCLVAAVHCLLDLEGEIFLDATDKEEKGAQACMTFVFDSVDRNVVMVHAVGKYSVEQFNKCMSVCRTASADIFHFYRETMTKKLKRSL